MYNDINFEKTMNEKSLRDISKLFERMLTKEKNIEKYINIGLKENILFYIISSINESLINVLIIIDIIKEIFHLDDENTKELYKLDNAFPSIILKEDEKKYIKRNYCEVYLGD